MKLGICCVYFYGPEGKWILDLQLHYIQRTLTGYNYTIYAGVNRLQPELIERLKAEPHVQFVKLPAYPGEGNREHAFYLDRLVQTAVEGECSHIVALDSDAFPIENDWPKILAH